MSVHTLEGLEARCGELVARIEKLEAEIVRLRKISDDKVVGPFYTLKQALTELYRLERCHRELWDVARAVCDADDATEALTLMHQLEAVVGRNRPRVGS